MYPFMINLLTTNAAFFLDLIHRNRINAILLLEVRFEELLAKYALLLVEFFLHCFLVILTFLILFWLFYY